MIETDAWEDCYEGGWGKLIVPEAFCHPAKFSRKLIERIYNHAMDNGWLKKGDFVLDPFGGVALGGLSAIARGINWVGVELEEKFVKLGEENINKWKSETRKDSGTARIIHGDSRKLKFHIAKLIGTPDLVVSSPPYADTPVAMRDGASERQMENLKKAVLSGKVTGRESVRVVEKGFNKNTNLNSSGGNYGQSPGQLGLMEEGEFDIAISSPPFENCHNIVPVEGHSRQVTSERVKSKIRYGYNKNQLGNTSGDTFWSASKEIVQESYDLLKQDGHAIWVAKDYVSKGKLIPFSDRWVTLCESVGFKVVCWHHAMVVRADQMGWLGSKIKTERKSFFRRLQEKKGSPRIDWENVICMVK